MTAKESTKGLFYCSWSTSGDGGGWVGEAVGWLHLLAKAYKQPPRRLQVYFFQSDGWGGDRAAALVVGKGRSEVRVACYMEKKVGGTMSGLLSRFAFLTLLDHLRFCTLALLGGSWKPVRGDLRGGFTGLGPVAMRELPLERPPNATTSKRGRFQRCLFQNGRFCEVFFFLSVCWNELLLQLRRLAN